MATYQQILQQAAAKGISAADVASKAASLGISVPSSSTGNLSLAPSTDVRASQKAAGMKDSVLVKAGTTGAQANQFSKPIDYDRTQWNLTNKQSIEQRNPSVEVNQLGQVVDRASTMQQAYNAKTPTNDSMLNLNNLGLPEDRKDWSKEDFDFANTAGEFNKNLQDTMKGLNLDSKSFMDNVNKNLQAQILKNEKLQQELANYKSKVDQDFELVRNKFDENAQAQIGRIDELERTYMQNLNDMRGLQSNYYGTQQEALNARVGGEQAGLQGKLSGKGIDQSVINDAIAKARTKHLDQYNSLQNQNINMLAQLNDAYKGLAESVNTQRANLENSDLALVKQKFDLHKEMNDIGRGYGESMVKDTFKPYEDALSGMMGAQTKEMSYAAGDQQIAQRFIQGSQADRMQLLQNKLANITQDASGGSSLTKVDIAMLNKAASMTSYPEALQYLINAGNAVAASGTASAIGSAASSGSLQKVISGEPVKTGADSIGTGDNEALSNILGDNNVWASNLESANDKSGISLSIANAAKEIVGKFGWNPLKWPSNIIQRIKDTPNIVRALANIMTTAGRAEGLKGLMGIASKGGSYINPMYVGIDIANSGVLDNKQQVESINQLNDAIAKAKTKMNEYTSKGEQVPVGLMNAYKTLYKQRYGFDPK